MSAPAADAAYRIDGRTVSATAFYAAACDPRRSLVVEACAGAGKTWMLVSRILRALLAGAQPQEILALTFTRKAAGEMRARLDQWLREFSVPGTRTDADLERLAGALVQRGVEEAEARRLAPALAVLHERVLQSGRSVAIRSFHAWFSQLLAAAPMETLRALGLPAQHELMEDTSVLADELFLRFHRAVQADPARRDDYAVLIRRHRLPRVTAWLQAAWDKRLEVERADAAGTLAGSVLPAAAIWSECAGLDSPLALIHAQPLASTLAALASELGALSNKIPRDAGAALRAALDLADPAEAYRRARKVLLTDKGEPRKRMGDLRSHVDACEALDAIGRMQAQHDAHEDHVRMVRLSRVLLRAYAELKREHGIVDMGDLETAALALLSDPDLAGWLQLRLDARLRHVLIDEFQDTSPLQWHALHGWLSAYAGAGGGASGQAPPSVFIVGDPKQSIYRFRRAEPRVFEAAKDFVVQGLGGAILSCDHTRRCAPEVVQALNAVFAPLSATGEWHGFRAHTTAAREAGRLSVLPDVLRPEKEKSEKGVAVWRDTLNEPRHEPEEQLRMQEARHVAQAIAALVAQGARPGEIMVLARKRVALQAVSEALAQTQVPHVMPAALQLGDEPEARDLLAVLDVLASPGHDLSLAQALKSPLFGATDDDLLALSRAAAGGSWWQALLDDERPWTGALDRARRLLARWATVQAWLPPHDLLDRIVHEGELVPRLTAVVPEGRRALALQVVESLLAASLDLDGGRYASPYGFVRALRARPVDAEAAAPGDAVRLLTVHGAKGLEAEVVFIVDADPNPGTPDQGTLLVDWPVDADAPRRVAFVAVDSRPPPSLQALVDEEMQARAREELNGLYVAMTRAARHLVVSRTEPNRTSGGPSWWARVAPLMTAWTPAGSADASVPSPAPPMRSWIDLPDLPPMPRPTAPSRPADATRDAERAALGTAIHRVLEWATSGAAPDLAGSARAAVVEAGAAPEAAAAVERCARAVLESAECRRFFDPNAAVWAGNEVPVLVDGLPGRIDRLVAFDEPGGRVWWVLDYKLDADAERRADNRAQMDGYLRAIRELQPGDQVVGAFVTADGRVQRHGG